MQHFDLNNFRASEQSRVKISLAAVFAFVAIGWPLIIAQTGLTGWFKFWLMPWLGFHFWVRAVGSLAAVWDGVRWDGMGWTGRMGRSVQTMPDSLCGGCKRERCSHG